MIKRSLTHIIDTKAVRVVITTLDENWLVRGLDERDYGIDLVLERFAGEAATGDYCLIQVKGTADSFAADREIKIGDFPVKTIQYAKLFNIPFFVFYVSVADEMVYFLWLQKYSETKLKETTHNWETQDTVTLYFPEENKLHENIAHLTNIIKIDKSIKMGVRFLSLLENLRLHSGSVTEDKEFDVADACKKIVLKIDEMSSFIDGYKNDITDLDLNELMSCYENIRDLRTVDEDDLITIDEQIELLTDVAHNFLNKDDNDEFCTRNCIGGEPY
jgi:hypothetical protein